MNVPICEHLNTSGTRCGSPAMRDHSCCFYHERMRQAMPTTMFYEENPNRGPLEFPVLGFNMPTLDDLGAIQIAYMQLIHGVTSNRLDARRGRLILMSLQGAASNLRRMERVAKQAKRALERNAQSVPSETPMVQPKSAVTKKKPTSVRAKESRKSA